MQVTETLAEGLRREFKVVVPATELDERLNDRLTQMKNEVRIKGFRPGKVPVSHLRRLFGRSAMAEIVQSLITEVARDTISDRGERAAQQPDFALPEDEQATERVLRGEADLTYTMSYEILPAVELKDYKSLSVERPMAEVTDAEVDAEVERIAEGTRGFTPKETRAESGDRVTVSYVGKIDGETFEGGSEEDRTLRLGTSQFIPGFAEQLEGLQAGETKTISVDFPEDYPAKNLAGRTATFDVTIKEVAAPDELKIDNEMAERIGMESLERLRDVLRQQIQSQFSYASRQKVKRQLLDQLDAMHAFDLPPRMVEQEFENIWRQITTEMAQTGKTFESEDTTEEAVREDYRRIAERRVRLGLVLAEVGEKNKIEVTEDEVQRALAAQLRQFPGQEQRLIDYYRSRPEAVAGLRAPIFEDKVVDFLLELVSVTDKPVSREELLSDDETEEAAP